MKRSVIGAALALLLFGHSDIQAQEILYQTGFEPGEGYSLGTLAGQQGWVGSNLSQVQNSVVKSGTQAVSIAMSGQTGQFLAFRGFTPSTTRWVSVSIDALLSSAGTLNNWVVLAVYGTGSQFVGQIVVLTASGTPSATLGLASGTVGEVPVPLGVWNTFRFDLDTTDHIMTASVNGQLIGSGAFATPTSSIGNLLFGSNAFSTKTGSFDNVVVTAIPEPSPVVLFGTLLPLAGVVARTATRQSSGRRRS
ncbi:MAG: hypothetical protein U0794_10720 [Isosphaeraceae bacterium]